MNPAAKGRIYVDFDDVLCETAQVLLEVLRREFGKVIALDEVRSFDLSISFGLTPAELARFMQAAHQPDVLAAMPPVRGATDVLQEWLDEGYEVWIVTGRPVSSATPSRQWLAEHRIPHTRILFVDKYLRHTPDPALPTATTLEELRAIDFCLAIDDSPTMIRFLVEQMRMPVVVFDQPWNTDPGAKSPRLLRCKTWPEIRDVARNCRQLPKYA